MVCSHCPGFSLYHHLHFLASLHVWMLLIVGQMLYMKHGRILTMLNSIFWKDWVRGCTWIQPGIELGWCWVALLGRLWTCGSSLLLGVAPWPHASEGQAGGYQFPQPWKITGNLSLPFRGIKTSSPASWPQKVSESEAARVSSLSHAC